MATFAVKLAALVIKTATKPLAAQITMQARGHAGFRRVCAAAGQMRHNVETRVALRLAGHRAQSVKPLAEEKASNLGANLMSELIVLGIASAILLFEFDRKAKVDDDKARKARAAKEEAERALDDRFAAVEQRIQGIERQVFFVAGALPPLSSEADERLRRAGFRSVEPAADPGEAVR